MKPAIALLPAVSSISVAERESLTSSPLDQDEAHRRGAYEYLDGVDMCPRYGCIAAYVRALGRRRILDIGCGNGSLRHYLSEDVDYLGVDVSPYAIERAKAVFSGFRNTEFECIDIRERAITPVRYDCVVWAGVGRGFGKAGEESEFGWREIFGRMDQLLAPGGVLIFETIVAYRDLFLPPISGFGVLSSWQVSCRGSSDHPDRLGWVLSQGDEAHMR